MSLNVIEFKFSKLRSVFVLLVALSLFPETIILELSLRKDSIVQSLLNAVDTSILILSPSNLAQNSFSIALGIPADWKITKLSFSCSLF